MYVIVVVVVVAKIQLTTYAVHPVDEDEVFSN